MTAVFFFILTDSLTTYWKVSSDDDDDDSTWWYRPRSADVETTSYALLATMKMSSNDNLKVTSGLPIVKWLSQQRNSYGGFGSTQVSSFYLCSLVSSFLLFTDFRLYGWNSFVLVKY